MRLAIADPPYLGCAKKLYGDNTYDSVEAHAALLQKLATEYDGWAYCLHSVSLRTLLPLAPPEARVGAWVKPWAVWKPGQRVAHAWEPLIFIPARPKEPRKSDPNRRHATVTDWCSVPVTMGRRDLQDTWRESNGNGGEKKVTKDGAAYCPGAKPLRWCFWLFEVLTAEPDDEFEDLFPGSGAVTNAWQDWCARRTAMEDTRPALEQGLLEDYKPAL